eukprot:2742961-Pleurochrysis_carterae.AAC.2
MVLKGYLGVAKHLSTLFGALLHACSSLLLSLRTQLLHSGQMRGSLLLRLSGAATLLTLRVLARADMALGLDAPRVAWARLAVAVVRHPQPAPGMI